MSVKVTTHIWHSELEGSALLIALAMADHANDVGDGIEAGRKYLAWKTGLSERTITSFLADFRSHGWLEIMEQPAPGRATCYRLHYGLIPKKQPYPNVYARGLPGGENSAPDDSETPKSSDRAQNERNGLRPILNHTKNLNGGKTNAKGEKTARFNALDGVADDPTQQEWLDLPDRQLTAAELKTREHYLERKEKTG